MAKRAADVVFTYAVRLALVGKRFERVILVAGLRRSGNHAVITWIVNGLEGDGAEVTYDERTYVGISGSGRTVHYNNAKLDADPRYLAHVLRTTGRIRRASFLVVSYEDVFLDSRLVEHHLAARATTRVVVRRSVLNLVASRIKYRGHFVSRADADYQMPLDDEFLSKVVDHARDVGPGFLTVRFDDLVSDQRYRTDVAGRLGLVADLPIHMSRSGLGSSFTGWTTIPGSTDLAARWRQVDWPSDLVGKIWDLRGDLRLSEEEITALRDLRTGPPATG